MKPCAVPLKSGDLQRIPQPTQTPTHTKLPTSHQLKYKPNPYTRKTSHTRLLCDAAQTPCFVYIPDDNDSSANDDNDNSDDKTDDGCEVVHSKTM